MKPFWSRLGTEWLPFADAATPELPLPRLLRLGLFQVSVAMAAVLLVGTLNRVMIVELHFPAWIVALLVGIPLTLAPLRALIGHKSDHHRSILGWRRVPYIWFGTLMQFGGLAIMPFALLILSGDNTGNVLPGQIGAGLAFLLVGLGVHTTQTAGLALAIDLAPPATRPRVVALMYLLLVAGALVSSLVIGRLLVHFSPLRLVQVVQGVAALTMMLNLVALWKQEARHSAPAPTASADFATDWRAFMRGGRAARLLVAIGLGSAGFQIQDVLIEPYGGQILRLPISATSVLTAFGAAGAIVGFALAARRLARGGDPHRIAGAGALVGVVAVFLVLLAAPFDAPALLGIGVGGIGLGGGLFAVGTLTASMALVRGTDSGIALGAWGAVQASAAGVAILAGGAIRDLVAARAASGSLGPALDGPVTGYAAVYALEIFLLFATLAAIGPLARRASLPNDPTPRWSGLAGLPA